MNTKLSYISEVWPSIKSIFSVPHSENDYKELVDMLDNMIDEVGENETHELASVMETIGRLIENYEEQSFEIKENKPIENLKYLMSEHGLKQSDLKEIGSQGVVSEILTGKRILNIEQIKKISSRFHVSPVVFI